MKIIGFLHLFFLAFFIAHIENFVHLSQLNIEIVQDSTKKDTVQNKILDKFIDDTMKIDKVSIDTNISNYFYGIASFYSKNLDGTETATGEIFRHNKLTAASNRFKLNTWLRVTRIYNGKSIIVRVNDRMHPRMDRKGRIVDLTIRGAEKLGFIKSGLTKVKVEIVPKGTLK